MAQLFMKRFDSSIINDEASCWRHLIQTRWPEGIFCPSCRATMRLKISRAVFQCPHCAKELSPTSGTIFHKSRLSLAVWFQAMHLMLSAPDGISARELQRRLNLRSYRAAWLLAQKIRTAMSISGEQILKRESDAPEQFIKKRGRARGRGVTHGWSSKYHRTYVAELAYRASYANRIDQAFGQLLAVCLAHPPATLREIKA